MVNIYSAVHDLPEGIYKGDLLTGQKKYDHTHCFSVWMLWRDVPVYFFFCNMLMRQVKN